MVFRRYFPDADRITGRPIMEIIIRGKSKFGRTRSEQEQNLRKEWGGTITDEQLDKMKYLEKKAKEVVGSTENFISAITVDKVK
jgi:hypothetical protein